MRGAALVESLPALFVSMLLGMGLFEMTMLHRTRILLEYAVLMSARAGATSGLDPLAMNAALASALAPAYSGTERVFARERATARARADITAGFGCLHVDSPGEAAFADFATDPDGDGTSTIPNAGLAHADPAPGSRSGSSLQDANRLDLAVLYGAKPTVPWIAARLARTLAPMVTDPEVRRMLAAGRWPLRAATTVRMQSEAQEWDWLTVVGGCPPVLF